MSFPEDSPNPAIDELPVTFQNSFLTRWFFWVYLVFEIYFLCKNLISAEKAGVGIILLSFVLLVYFASFSQFARVEKDRLIFKPYLFFGPRVIYWKDVTRIELYYSFASYSLKNGFYFYVNGRVEPFWVSRYIFVWNNLEKFLALLPKLAPQASIQVPKIFK